MTTCCRDNNVRVFDVSVKSSGCLRYVLNGHSQRAFCAAWCPLSPGVVATGSDDTNILLWHVDLDADPDTTAGKLVKPTTVLNPTMQLSGHKSNIRALAWNYECRYVPLLPKQSQTIHAR